MSIPNRTPSLPVGTSADLPFAPIPDPEDAVPPLPSPPRRTATLERAPASSPACRRLGACLGPRMAAVASMVLLAASSPAAHRDTAPESIRVEVEGLGPHEQRVRTIVRRQDPETGRWSSMTNVVVRLEDGLNFRDPATRSWIETREEILPTPDGAAEARGPLFVRFAPNVNDPRGAVRIEASDGGIVRASVLALAYFDAVSGRRVVFATARDRAGSLRPPNQVIYRGAFDGLKADVLYTYRRRGLEADVILRELPPAPDAFGLLPEACRLEVLTEFFETPTPRSQSRVLDSCTDPDLRRRLAEPDWIDEELDFGAHRFVQGRAFAWDDRGQAEAAPHRFAPVGKRWLADADGRRMLVESVELPRLADPLLRLPGPDASRTVLARLAEAWNRGSLPERRDQAIRARSDRPPRRGGPEAWPVRRSSDHAPSTFDASPELAFAEPPDAPGVVLDWQTVVSGTDRTFRAGETYHLTGPVTLTGNVVLQGGTVLKFASAAGGGSPSLVIAAGATLQCATDPYRPVVFTGEDDDSVGSIIGGRSDGVVGGGTYGTPMLAIEGTASTLRHVRFRHAATAVEYRSEQGVHLIRHAQFVDGATGVRTLNGGSNPVELRLQNVLVARTTTGIANVGADVLRVVGEHLTVSDCAGRFVDIEVGAAASQLISTNGIFRNVAAITGGGTVLRSGAHNLFFQSASPTSFGLSPFTTAVDPCVSVAGGSHYLADPSAWRNAGVTPINPDLASDLARMTTQAPQILADPIVSATALAPRVARDGDAPDLGYHYPPLDYLTPGVRVTADLSLAAGTAVGAYRTAVLRPAGFFLARAGIALDALGNAFSPVHLVYYNTVQESAAGLPRGTALSDASLIAFRPDSVRVRLEFARLAAVHGAFDEAFLSSQALGMAAEGAESGPLEIAVRHSEFHAGGASRFFRSAGSVGFTNNLFFHHDLVVGDADEGHPTNFRFYNNLVKGFGHPEAGGAFRVTTFAGDYRIKDNIFDGGQVLGRGIQVDHSHNAYVSNPSSTVPLPKTPADTTSLVLPSLTYASGPLGDFYRPPGSPSSDVGSRGAGAAGLVHFTTVATPGASEGTGPVDLGYHYLALNSQNQPLDGDGDQIPDHVEDPNGNGVQDAGETANDDPDSDYDGRNDGQEATDGTNPLDPSSYLAVRLATWTFDNPAAPFRGSNGSLPVETNAIRVIETDSFVYGIEITNTTSVLRYRDVESTGLANINARQGTIKLFLSPYWASADASCPGGTAGTGPGTPIELLSIGAFSIALDAKGTNLMLRSPDGNGGLVTNVQTAFRACVDEYPSFFPAAIEVAYATNASAIFINGQRVAIGSGVAAWPDRATRSAGLFFGSSPARTAQVKGIIDAVETWNVPLNLCTNAPFLSATFVESPPSITLHFSAQSNCFYKVERRLAGESAWNRIASVPPPSYTDSSVLVGRQYEYRLSADVQVPAALFASTDPAYVKVSGGIRLPPAEFPGHLLLVVDKSLTNQAAFRAGLDTLKADLSAEGWVVARYDAPRHDDLVWANNPARIAEVKAWISSYAQAHPGLAKAVYLLGHVPMPRSGMLSPDGHLHRPLPADVYYGDLDGLWTDVRNWALPPVVETANLAGDGIFDQGLVPTNGVGVAALELAVGRVDFATMPSFAAGSPARQEVDLLVQYLAKSRKFRRGQGPQPERVIYGPYFSTSAAGELTEPFGLHMTRFAKQLAIPISGLTPSGFTKADFFAAGLPAVWGLAGGYAGAYTNLNSRGDVNAYYGISLHRTPDLVPASGEPPILFSLIYSSWSADWNQPDHLVRALLGTRTNGLAWSYAGSTRIEWQYPIMALGRTLGDGLLATHRDAGMWPLLSATFGEATGTRVFTGSPAQGAHIFAGLLGDPTLRQAPASAPGTLTGTVGSSGQIELSWGASPDPGARYHVYRTTEGIGGNWTRLTATPLATTGYTDAQPPGGDRRYLVRPLVLKTVQAGSYTNLAAGSLWP